MAAPGATIYADGAVVAGAGYTLTPDWTDGAGRHVAVVTFTSSQLGTRIGYRGKGIKDTGGALIENPIAIAQDLLLNRLGLAAGDVDATGYAAAVSRATLQGYIAAGVLQDDRSMAYTLSELLGPFPGAAVLTADRRITFRLDIGTLPPPEQIAHYFDAAKATGVQVVYDRSNLINQVAIDYCYNGYDQGLQQTYQASDDGSTTLDATSQQQHGAVGPGVAGRVGIPAGGLDPRPGDRVRDPDGDGAKWAQPRAIITMTDATWRAAHLEAGDLACWSWPWLVDGDGLELRNQLVTVEGIQPDPRGRVVILTLQDTGYWLTRAYLADGSVAAAGRCAPAAIAIAGVRFVTDAERDKVLGLDVSTRAGLWNQTCGMDAAGSPACRLSFRDGTVIEASPSEWFATLRPGLEADPRVTFAPFPGATHYQIALCVA